MAENSAAVHGRATSAAGCQSPVHSRHLFAYPFQLTPLLYERLGAEPCFDLRIVLPEDDFLLLAFFLEGLGEEVEVVVLRFPPAIWGE